MPDYGHELAFGTFITPDARRPDDVVALAQLTERVGLDLATFQDHPYQPALLDTWTLLSWVAARTETLRVSANVTNLPLRPPAVLARAVAALDLLSGGRVELGLGAGAFWDAIAAMGGPRLGPGPAVDALDEAIDVIRGIWDTGERGGVRVRGEHHRVLGAKRGPQPAHDIAIWVGAYKPRMLGLVGRKADGWLPSMSYMPLEGLRRGNRAIDEAATGSGRDPREVRRLLNLPPGSFSGAGRGFLQGPPERWVGDLLPLVLEDGFSTFILMGDDPEAIRVFGGEVAPALREAVARERGAAGTTGAPARGARARALRRDGIDYDALPASLASGAVEPGDRAYSRVRSSYIHRGSPGLVLRPRSVDEVVEGLAFARRHPVPLSIRSGGHGISGRSTNDGGVVIDMGAFDAVEVLDRGSGRVRLGPGARWGEVARTLGAVGLGMSSGDYGDVGVGGLVTAGGIGFMARKHGLTIDHVTAAELVLADGSVVRADRGSHPELLWAVRGAGANFGVVTAVELEAYEVGDVVFSTMDFAAPRLASLLERWGAHLEGAPRELTSFLNLFPRPGAAPLVRLHSVFAGDDTRAAVEALAPLTAIGPLTDQQAVLLPYAQVIAPQGGVHRGRGAAQIHSGLLDHLDGDVARILTAGAGAGDALSMQIRSVGGAVNDVDPSATAYAHRSQNFALSAVGAPSRAERLDGLWRELSPHISGLYISFETDRDPRRLDDAFPGQTLVRLRDLKARYDPDGVFDQNFAIPPSSHPPSRKDPPWRAPSRSTSGRTSPAPGATSASAG